MKKILLVFLWLSVFICIAKPVFAADNPLAVPNNKFGIHILFPAELQDAAKLINSTGGDWGYVTIPIQAGDKDLKKWQAFMDQAKRLHVIPIIRLATENNYFDTTTWRKPTAADVLDFANFLGSLAWPTKNKYVIVFNEVNRSDEWGGQANPAEYADILSYAVTAFKSKDPNFFVISAGLDNAAATSGNSYNEYTFFEAMNQTTPGIFNQVDGLASHSYPNPGFSEPPTVQTQESITSFSYERNFIQNMDSKLLPIFITETGWTESQITPKTIGTYFQQAFTSVWTDPGVVAVTPFLLKAGGGPFTQFSFMDNNGNPNDVYKAIFSMQKVKGQPLLCPLVLSASDMQKTLPVKDFSDNSSPNIVFAFSKGAKGMLKWFLHW